MKKGLDHHPIYKKINDLEQLRFFMERHVYAVFDFMSLLKNLQRSLAPVTSVWIPPQDRELARFINEIVLGEESDLLPSGKPISHFEMYCEAMREVNACSEKALEFSKVFNLEKRSEAYKAFEVPRSAQSFMDKTFSLIEEGKVHKIAASFCFGREDVIPEMFQGFLLDMEISEGEAPTFFYYLKRHIEVDGDSHGPLALKMIEVLCGNDSQKWKEVQATAVESIQARETFWNDILRELNP